MMGWSFNVISNDLKNLEHKTQNISILGRQVLIYYYIIFYIFLYVLNSWYWTNTSKDVMLEPIKPSSLTSAGISSHLWSFSSYSEPFHSPNSSCPHIKVKYAFLSASPPWAWLCPPGQWWFYCILSAEMTYMASLLQRSRTLSLMGNLLKYALSG